MHQRVRYIPFSSSHATRSKRRWKCAATRCSRALVDNADWYRGRWVMQIQISAGVTLMVRRRRMGSAYDAADEARPIPSAVDMRGYEIRQSQGRQSVSQSDCRSGRAVRTRSKERRRERAHGERLASIHGQYITWQG